MRHQVKQKYPIVRTETSLSPLKHRCTPWNTQSRRQQVPTLTSSFRSHRQRTFPPTARTPRPRTPPQVATTATSWKVRGSVCVCVFFYCNVLFHILAGDFIFLHFPFSSIYPVPVLFFYFFPSCTHFGVCLFFPFFCPFFCFFSCVRYRSIFSSS